MERSVIRNLKRKTSRKNMFEDYEPKQNRQPAGSERREAISNEALTSADITFIDGVVGMWKDNGKDVALLLDGIQRVVDMNEGVESVASKEAQRAIEERREQVEEKRSEDVDKQIEEDVSKELEETLSKMFGQ